MAIEAGQQLLHYRLIEKIGEGGMGVVWKAEDTKLQRHVALKVLPEAMAADPERRARFEREARAVAALNHPNIVTLHSVEEAETPAPSTGSGQAGSVHFITMELVEGRTLTQLLPKSGFPLNRLLEIGIPLADAVSRAHRAGITHRDLKPDNIMIDGEGRLRVLDFGLAKLQDPSAPTQGTQIATVTSDTAEGRVLGTVAYMSPEQTEGKEVDARSDIFSLGTILFEMATGVRPFQGETTMSTIGSILKEEPSSITELRPTLPRHAGRILRRCLAKNPDRRYQTSLDLRNELEELKQEIDSGVHATGPDSATPSRGSRVPMLVVAVAALAVALFAAIWFRDGEELPAVEYVPRPVTATSGWDAEPAWSPDGKLIAFTRMTSGSLDIYVQPIDGGEAVARVELPGEQASVHWTPDGRYLSYLSKHRPGSPVFLSPVDGGTPRELIATNSPTLDFGGSAMGDRPWSNDGRTLLLSMPTEGGQLAVHKVDGTTGEAEQITFPQGGSRDTNPTYSFDGERIVFRREIEGRGAVMLKPAAGGDPEVLLGDEFDYEAAAWRPDNRRVVFISSRGSPFFRSLFEIDVVTRRIRRLTSDSRRINWFSVSADDRITYASFWHDQFFYVVDVETGTREQITSHAGRNRSARFSPDGLALAYDSNRTGNGEIWLRYLDGRPDANTDGATEARLLVDQAINWGTSNSTLYNNPVAQWSPDGESIAYRVVGHEGPELWTVGPDGRNARKRLDDVSGFDWYRNSRQALITRPHGTEDELLAVDLETLEMRSLFVGALQEIDVAPDGSAVSFCYGLGHTAMGLAVLKLEPASDPDGLPRAAGEPEYLIPTEETWHIHFASWSPDSKRLVYTKDTDYGHIFELVEAE
jgi:Tol biopolymer transport system component